MFRAYLDTNIFELFFENLSASHLYFHDIKSLQTIDFLIIFPYCIFFYHRTDKKEDRL